MCRLQIYVFHFLLTISILFHFKSSPPLSLSLEPTPLLQQLSLSRVYSSMSVQHLWMILEFLGFFIAFSSSPSRQTVSDLVHLMYRPAHA